MFKEKTNNLGQVWHVLGKMVKPFNTKSELLTTLEEKCFENIAGKGENAGNQHFLLFPQCIQPFPNQVSIFQLHLFCRLQILSISKQSKILSSTEELNLDGFTILSDGKKLLFQDNHL